MRAFSRVRGSSTPASARRSDQACTPPIERGMKIIPTGPYGTRRSTTSCPRSRSDWARRSTCSRTSGSRRRETSTHGGFSARPIRSLPGSRVAAAANGSSGAAGRCRSPATLPVSTSSSSAASPTLRASGPWTVRPSNASASGQVEIRPRCGLIPTRLVHDAGIRTDPAPSDPTAAATSPAATAAADPPDDPPGEYAVFHGFRVGSHSSPTVIGHWPSSGVVVLPTITAPAARSRVTISASSVATSNAPEQPNRVS